MIGLAKKLGFVEYLRKPGIRQVRGEVYDGLTFRLDVGRWEELELHVPEAEELWFRAAMEADPATMAYNAGWEVDFPGYHRDTGCVDLPPEDWEKEHRRLTGREPERFYAYVRRKMDGAFLGEVNFQPAGPDTWGMGVLLHAPYRGRGYGRRALELLLERAFVTDGVPKLRNDFEAGRDAALAIHLAAGFRQAGTQRARRFGRDIDLLVLELSGRNTCPGASGSSRWTTRGSAPPSPPRCWPICPAGLACRRARWSTWKPAGACPSGRPGGAGRTGLPGPAADRAGGSGAVCHGGAPGVPPPGPGAKALEAAYQYAKTRGYRFLQVKTVQEGRYPEYDRTNAFYRALGFTELECLPTLWDAWNPCQLFILSVE